MHHMNIHNPHIINLREELSYMLVSSACIVTGKLESSTLNPLG
jgi:hypothetical protein